MDKLDHKHIKDGHVQVSVDPDLMKATVDLFPPSGGGSSFTLHDVLGALAVQGVVSGLLEHELEQAVLRCLTQSRVMRGVIAAVGVKAVKSVPSYWHLKSRLLGKHIPNTDAIQLDYKKINPFILVKKGEALAKRVPASAGEPGRNVKGEVLQTSEKDVVTFRPGENILERDDVLYAGVHGRFVIQERVMTVNETLEVPGNVDYSTGHISFPGDVVIRGSVRDGFRVASGKSIFIKETMDATQVLARGDLEADGGIKGRGEGLVKVDGRVMTKFVENCRIEAHGDIIVGKSILNSRLYTLGRLDLGDKGILVSCEVWAKEGVVAQNIGRPESPASTLWTGMDYTLERKLRHVRSHLENLEQKLEALKASPERFAKNLDLVGQVEKAMESMVASEKTFSHDLYKDAQRAFITVLGTILPGTVLHIGDLSLRITEEASKVTYYYEPDGPRIATRPASLPRSREEQDQEKDSPASDTSVDHEVGEESIPT